jgi:pentose-5-phosphate-3-epimerase
MKPKKTKLNQVKTMLCISLIIFIAISCSKNDFDTKKEFGIGPKSTFLRVDAYDSSDNPVIINLEDNGITAGVVLRIRTIGAYINSTSGNTRNDAIGVFSASAQLLGTSELNRVVDAIDAGEERVTDNTWSGNLTTDIAEDFGIDEEAIKITVPSGAKYLFVGNADCLHSDNSETTEGFKVEIAY